MEFTTKSELKAAYDAEITEKGLVKSFSKLLPELMVIKYGEVPSEITAYLNDAPQSSVLEKLVYVLFMTSNTDEFLGEFQQVVSESQAARP